MERKKHVGVVGQDCCVIEESVSREAILKEKKDNHNIIFVKRKALIGDKLSLTK
jgi:hypothetical protein